MKPMDALEAIRRAAAARWASLPWRIQGGAVAVIAGIRGFHRGAQQSAQARLVWRRSGRPLSNRLRPTPHQLMGARDHRGVAGHRRPDWQGSAQTNRAAQDWCTVSKTAYSVPTFSRMESVEAVQTTEPAARSLAPSAARSLPLRSRPSRLAIALGANEQRRRARPLSSAGRRQRDDCLPRRDAPRAESAAARFARKARAKPVSLGHGPADGLAADSMLMEATDQSVRKLTLTAARRYGLWSVASHRNCAIGMSS